MTPQSGALLTPGRSVTKLMACYGSSDHIFCCETETEQFLFPFLILFHSPFFILISSANGLTSAG